MRVVQNPIDIATDYIKDMFASHSAEFTAVYSLLNSIQKLQASATAPESPMDGEVYLDITDRTNPELKVNTGGSWVTVCPAAIAERGKMLLEHMFSTHRKNMTLYPTTTLLDPVDPEPDLTTYVPASPEVPAVIYIGTPGSGKLYKNESDSNNITVYSASANTFVWAKANGTGFDLVATTTSASPGSDHRFIGKTRISSVLVPDETPPYDDPKIRYTISTDELCETVDVQPQSPY